MSVYSKFSDQQLAVFLKGGDEAAYAEIYKRFWAILYRHARRMLHDGEEAEDVTQDVFLTLWSKAAQLELKSSLSAYLYTTVRNKILDRFEHDKVKAKFTASLDTFIEKGEYETDHLIREKQLHELINQEIALLPEAMRTIFELSRNSHLSYKEIAEQLEISESAVRNQVSRALRILRSKFGTIVIFALILKGW